MDGPLLLRDADLVQWEVTVKNSCLVWQVISSQGQLNRQKYIRQIMKFEGLGNSKTRWVGAGKLNCRVKQRRPLKGLGMK